MWSWEGLNIQVQTWNMKGKKKKKLLSFNIKSTTWKESKTINVHTEINHHVNLSDKKWRRL